MDYCKNKGETILRALYLNNGIAGWFCNSIASAVWMCRVSEKYYREGVFQGGIPRVMHCKVVLKTVVQGCSV